MGSKQETIADIIAEKRRRADEIERDCAEKMKRGEMISDCYARELVADIRREADRLEAANRREVDKLNSAIQATVGRSDAEIDRLRREVEELKKTNGELATLIDLEKIPPIELSKNASRNGADFGQFDAEAIRVALKDVEATVTAALAHQPEDEAKCGRFLYDALVKCFNIADLACHAARTENGAAVSREAATAENSSAVGNAAKLREAMKRIVAASIVAKNANAPEWILKRMADIFAVATTALAAPPRNCDKCANHNDAMKAFAEFVTEQGKLGLINHYHGVLRWLFARATENEGGVK